MAPNYNSANGYADPPKTLTLAGLCSLSGCGRMFGRLVVGFRFKMLGLIGASGEGAIGGAAVQRIQARLTPAA
jgi:hypothetical protein